MENDRSCLNFFCTIPFYALLGQGCVAMQVLSRIIPITSLVAHWQVAWPLLCSSTSHVPKSRTGGAWKQSTRLASEPGSPRKLNVWLSGHIPLLRMQPPSAVLVFSVFSFVINQFCHLIGPITSDVRVPISKNQGRSHESDTRRS